MTRADQIAWSVTDFGIEAKGTVSYLIPKEDLAKIRDARAGIGDWPLQMVEKSWVHMDDFWKAYVEGLQRHQSSKQASIDLAATWLAVSKTLASRP